METSAPRYPCSCWHEERCRCGARDSGCSRASGCSTFYIGGISMLPSITNLYLLICFLSRYLVTANMAPFCQCCGPPCGTNTVFFIISWLQLSLSLTLISFYFFLSLPSPSLYKYMHVMLQRTLFSRPPFPHFGDAAQSQSLNLFIIFHYALISHMVGTIDYRQLPVHTIQVSTPTLFKNDTRTG